MPRDKKLGKTVPAAPRGVDFRVAQVRLISRRFK
jgi:hypothetical protein